MKKSLSILIAALSEFGRVLIVGTLLGVLFLAVLFTRSKSLLTTRKGTDTRETNQIQTQTGELLAIPACGRCGIRNHEKLQSGS